jgi:PAS domain S-box-containing protein
MAAMSESPALPVDPILDSIADGVFTVDKEWNVTSFNRAAETITGTPRRSAIGRKCWEVFHADVCERECLLKKTMKTGRQCVNKTVHIIDTTGRTIPISVSTALLKNNRGMIIGGVETFRDVSEIEELRKEVTGRFTLGDMTTGDHRLLQMFETLPVIARSETPVLVLGESGTGKELLARALHTLSARSKGPFVPVNCGALPENLLESELFGYKKGAFTDAKTDKPGRFQMARGGTLFLDEIADLPRSVQVKLLRVLQEKTYEPLGATVPVTADVRIIAATNRDIERMVETGEFRRDLYYRVNVLPLTLPPLRERQGDIPLLIERFIRHFNTIFGKVIERVDSEAMEILCSHGYPGNIRELENALQHAFVLCQGKTIEKKHLPAALVRKPVSAESAATPVTSPAQFDRQRIEAALVRNRYNRTRTARELGMHVTTLWRKMRKYGMEQ